MRTPALLAPLVPLAVSVPASGCGSDGCADGSCDAPAGECTTDGDCTSPPGPCDQSPGTCEAGTCSYAPAPVATYCLDADGDGYCTAACGDYCAATAPESYRSDCAAGIDCDDANGAVNPGTGLCCAEAEKISFCEDQDGDGHCTAHCVSACPSAAPAGYRAAASCLDTADCNDASASIHPGAVEVACNNVDDNCDGDNPYQCESGTQRPCSVCDQSGTQSCVDCRWEPLCRNVDRSGHWYGADPRISHYFEGPPANGDVCGFAWNDPRNDGWCRANAWCIDNSLFSPDADRNCYAVYGPYARLAPGDYEVRFDVYYKGAGFLLPRVKARYDVWDGVQRLANLDYDVPASLDVALYSTTLPFTVAPNPDGTPACRPVEFRSFLIDATSAQYHEISLRPIGGSDYPLPNP